MDAQQPAQSEPEVMKLDPRETFIIQTHANIRYAAASRLSTKENEDIQRCREQLHTFVKANGDAGRVALQLFLMEFDNNSNPPFGETFQKMEQVPWEEAVKMWQEGYIAQDGV